MNTFTTSKTSLAKLILMLVAILSAAFLATPSRAAVPQINSFSPAWQT